MCPDLFIPLADPQWTAALEQTGGYTDLPPAIDERLNRKLQQLLQ
ncbi:MAG: hypothetical protein ABFS24_13780 [Pseudomonadota bacterium]